MQLFIVAVTATATVAVADEMPFGCFKDITGDLGTKVGAFFSDGDRRDVRLYISKAGPVKSPRPPFLGVTLRECVCWWWCVGVHRGLVLG
jgi:hypothetical protein